MTVATSSVSRVDPVLDEFAARVGAAGPVCVVGGRTQWDIGGPPAPGTTEVAAPVGVVSHEPGEMIVRVRAGTTVAALNRHLASAGQMVPLDPVDPERATVGGVLAVGRSGVRRLRYGPLRDTVLEIRFASAAGEMVKAGGPVVKNVTGFDLCRLLVGSLGTLGALGEVVLRCQPVPASTRWLSSTVTSALDPFEVYHRLYRPSAVLWDPWRVWVLLEGDPADVVAQSELLGPTFAEVAGPPTPPGGARLSSPATALRRLRELAPRSAAVDESNPPWLAQIGVGIVETTQPAVLAAALGQAWPPVLSPGVARLHRELQGRFDPEGRLNPGRRVGS